MPFLDWVNKNQAVAGVKGVPYHLLRREQVYGEESENLLIQGDNLLALKALKPFYAGQVKCVFIDPPYNTQSAFEHYDDRLEHSQWLSMMYSRLSLIRDLMSEDGSLWIAIDDNEVHYLKVLCDEIFGRDNFIIQNTIKRSAPTGHKAINPSPVQVADYVLVYAKNKSKWIYRPQYTERTFDVAYNKFILNYELGSEHWKFVTLKSYLRDQGLTLDACLAKYPERIIRFAQPDFNGVGKETKELILESKQHPEKVFIQRRPDHADIYLLKGDRILFYKDKLREIDGALVTGELLTNMWLDVPYQGIANEGGVTFPKGKKPEKLIKRVLEIATKEGDLVLDSYAGSGTTGAVAHKMKRNWLMVEMGEQAQSHVIPRLERVLTGEDVSGISKSVNWIGGGGFTFCSLANPAFDQSGQINPEIKFPDLASFVWHLETGLPGNLKFETPLLGVHNGTAYYLLFNGILGDKRPLGGNVLSNQVLKAIHDIFPYDGPKVIYGEAVRLGANKLDAESITFKQIPYDINLV